MEVPHHGGARGAEGGEQVRLEAVGVDEGGTEAPQGALQGEQVGRRGRSGAGQGGAEAQVAPGSRAAQLRVPQRGERGGQGQGERFHTQGPGLLRQRPLRSGDEAEPGGPGCTAQAVQQVQERPLRSTHHPYRTEEEQPHPAEPTRGGPARSRRGFVHAGWGTGPGYRLAAREAGAPASFQTEWAHSRAGDGRMGRPSGASFL